MGQDDRVEDDFFERKAEREISFVGHVGPPVPFWRRALPIIMALLALGGVLVWHKRSPERGALWIMNPGPGPAQVEVSGMAAEVPAGELEELMIPVGAETVTAGGRSFDAEIKSAKGQVTLIDLGDNAGYVVADASWYYRDEAAPTTLAFSHVSTDGPVHVLPFPASQLIRPGRPLPDKGSPELRAFARPNKPLELSKVFRVSKSRLAEKAELGRILAKAMGTKDQIAYENLSMADTSTASTSTATQ